MLLDENVCEQVARERSSPKVEIFTLFYIQNRPDAYEFSIKNISARLIKVFVILTKSFTSVDVRVLCYSAMVTFDNCRQ